MACRPAEAAKGTPLRSLSPRRPHTGHPRRCGGWAGERCVVVVRRLDLARSSRHPPRRRELAPLLKKVREGAPNREDLRDAIGAYRQLGVGTRCRARSWPRVRPIRRTSRRILPPAIGSEGSHRSPRWVPSSLTPKASTPRSSGKRRSTSTLPRSRRGSRAALVPWSACRPCSTGRVPGPPGGGAHGEDGARSPRGRGPREVGVLDPADRDGQ